MASLILGAGVLTYNKIKESRTKRREKKLWREAEYKELERETEARLAGAGTAGGSVGGAGEKGTVKAKAGRKGVYSESESESESDDEGKAAAGVKGEGKGLGRNNPFSAGQTTGQATGQATGPGNGNANAGRSEMAKRNEPIGQSMQWWEERKRQ